jgi:DNA replication protein DnaC
LAMRADPPDKPQCPRKARTVSKIDPALRAAIRSAVAGESSWPLVMVGPAGTGKTCAALCLVDHAHGRYWTAGELCETLIRSQQGRLDWYNSGHGGKHHPEDVWGWVAGASVVALDEVGTRSVSDFAYETVKRVLDEREGKPLAVVSNLTLEALARLYDDRVSSRLAAGTVVEVAGRDRRLPVPANNGVAAHAP